MDKYYILAVQGLHVLSAGWRQHVPPNAELLPNLPPVESLLVHDAQCIYNSITTEALQTLHPYLPSDRLQKALQALVEKQVLQSTPGNTYRYTDRTLRQMRTTEQAVLTSAQKDNVLPPEQADRLAVLTTSIVDKIAFGPNPFPTPIFSLVHKGLAPSEHPLAQVQQRLIALLAYRDDCHVAAWRAEKYSPAAIRVATYLATTNQGIPIEKFLDWPMLYDEGYIRAGLKELQDQGDIQETGGSYQLTTKGAARHETVERLTDENFRIAFEGYQSEYGRKQWTGLMTALIDGSKAALGTNIPSTTTTIKLP